MGMRRGSRAGGGVRKGRGRQQSMREVNSLAGSGQLGTLCARTLKKRINYFRNRNRIYIK